MTVAEAVAACEARLLGAGVDTPRLDAQMLVAHALGVERTWVLAHGSDELAASQQMEALCARRASREPLAYILGWREFFGRRFIVTPDVLIPRHETETLIDAALAEKHVREVLDIGTGSGCIALTLALERPEWSVTACDISQSALEVARENAARLLHVEPLLGQARTKVRLLRSDLFAALEGLQFDLIVSNPPYVASDDPLPPEVKDHEPATALYADEGGLAVYRRLAEEAHRHLRAGGTLIVEVGDRQSGPVGMVFADAGWHVERTVNDLNGTPRAWVGKPLCVT